MDLKGFNLLVIQGTFGASQVALVVKNPPANAGDLRESGSIPGPRGMVQGGRREEGSGWGTRVYLWRIHVDIWQNQYNIVKFKKKRQKKMYALSTNLGICNF